jgi:hypothetical protein
MNLNVCLSCLSNHYFFLFPDGKPHVWGRNNTGTLGLGDSFKENDLLNNPHVFSFLDHLQSIGDCLWSWPQPPPHF